MHKIWGIRVEEHVETAGLDVSEHGMWGYPEFYIPVPGGYGTETHGHLGTAHSKMHRPIAVHTTPVRPEGASRGRYPPATAGRRRIFDVGRHGRLQAVQETDVVAVDEDVEEARHAVAFEHSALERGELGDERVERFTHGAGFDVDESLSAGFRSQHGWDTDLGHCFKRYSKGGCPL